MPARPARVCTYPGCQALSLTGRCGQHPREPWLTTRPTARIRGRKLQGMRAALFKANPLCAECKRAGRVTAATIRDHVIPLAEGGQDDASNEQGLCTECHDIKSQAEAQRGVRRWGGR